MAEDYYKTLGVIKSATKDQIKKAYKKLAMKFHPDRNKGNKQAEEKFKKINEAYAVLSDDEKRKQYDQFGAEGFSNRFSQEDIFKGFDFGNIFEEFGFGNNAFSSIFGGGNKSSQGQRFSFNSGGNPFEQNRAYAKPQNHRKPKNSEMELHITFEEAAFGTKKTISVNSSTGVERIVLNIPPGIESGKKLKIKEKGVVDHMTGQRGNLLCVVSVKPHPVFQRDGKDLFMEKEIKMTELILGGTVSITTLDNKKIELKIPPLSKNKTLLRIKGKGIPVKNQSPGNLLIRLIALLPKIIDEKQKELFQKLAESGI